MAPSVLDDRSAPPDADQLAQELGLTRRSRYQLTAALAAQKPRLGAVWTLGSKWRGLALQLMLGKRTGRVLDPRLECRD